MKLIKREVFGYPSPEDRDWLLTYEQFYQLTVKPENKINDFENQLLKTLAVGWKDRVEEIAVFDTGHIDPEHGRSWIIAVRLLERWDDVLTRGPFAKLPAAEEFRQFYGEKTHIRKFPDGSLCEAVVWTEGKARDDSVLLKIAKEVLTRHVGVVGLRKRQFFFTHMVSPLTDYDILSQAFEKVSTALYSFQDLPLVLASVVCTSPYYRRTMPFPPIGRHLFQNSNRSKMMPDHVARTVYGLDEADKEDDDKDSSLLPFFQPALHVMITMEHSPKFGENLEILNHFKTGFYIDIAEKLTTHGFFAVPTERGIYVDVNHVSFLLEIGQGKEIGLAKRLADQNRHNEITDGCDFKSLQYKIQQAPKLAAQMYNLSMRFPAFGPTCQLMKYFVGSHFLLNNLNPFLLELLVAEVFLRLDASRGHPPRDTFCGFIHVLETIATHDFVSQPLFIDFGDKLDQEKRQQLESHFINARPALPSIVVFTSEDESGINVTNNLEVVIVSRLIQICRGASVIVRKHIQCTVDAGFDAIKGNTMDNLGINMIIHLKYGVVVHPPEYSDAKKKAGQLKDSEKKKELPIVDFDVVDMFLTDLKKAFSSIALFFYNPFGGSQIGVAFRPSFLKQNMFKVNQSVCRKRTTRGLRPNIEEFKETIAMLGQGIVKRIDVIKK